MAQKLLIVCAHGDEDKAEQIAQPLRKAGYDVSHEGTVLVGQSPLEEASKFLGGGGPVVLCATARAIGTKGARLLTNAARNSPNVRVFIVQMEDDADVEPIAFGQKVAIFSRDASLTDLVASLRNFFPGDGMASASAAHTQAELRYRQLALDSCDLIDLANMPPDRELATRQLELRLLYVPLRVRVEIPAGGEEGEAALVALERRREAWRRPSLAAEPSPAVPVGERLGKARQLVILGDPGAGKSTMVRWIATSYLLRLNRDPDWSHLPDVQTLPAEDWLPVIIRCRDLRDPSSLNGALDDVLRYTLRKAEMKREEAAAFRELLPLKLIEGQALLLFDGLDEIAEPTARARFCQQIEQIHLAYPKAPLIATSRIVGYREMRYRIGRGFEHVTVADLSSADKDDFARRWCNLAEPEERRETAALDLIKDIHSTDRIERLTGNPMLLTTMALVKRKVRTLPRRRADLYWEAVQVLLNWRSELDGPIDSDEALPQLRYIGYEMCRRGVQQLPRPELLELLENMREEYPKVHAAKNHRPADFLKLLEQRTGILIEAGLVPHLGMTVPVFEFRHLTFQEYLAARALLDGQFPGRDRNRSLAQNVASLAGLTPVSGQPADNKESITAEQWREAIRLCVACLRNSSRDDEVDDIILAILQPLEGEDANRSARHRAILAVLCLADEPNVSNEVANKVLTEFVRQVATSLAEELFGDPAAKDALSELGGSQWAAALRSILIDHFIQDSGALRLSVAFLYSMLADASVPKAPDEMRLWIAERGQRLRDQEPRVAIEAALDLVGLDSRESVPVEPWVVAELLKGLAGPPPLQACAALDLGILNDESRGELRWRPSPEEIEKLAAVLADSATDSSALFVVCTILSGERDPRAVAPLIRLLSDKDELIVVTAADLLGDIGDNRAVDGLIHALEHSRPKVRRSAASALGKTADMRATEALVGRLQDPDPETREAAAEALGKIGSPQAVEPLISALQDPEEKVRLAVLGSLGKIADPRALEILLGALKDESLSGAAIEALGNTRNPRALEALLELLGNARWAYFAANAVASMGEAAVPGLLSKLGTADSTARSYAALALGQVGQPAVAPMIALLQGTDRALRAWGANVLGHIKDIATVEPLMAALGDEYSLVRWWAAEALGELGQAQAVGPLAALIDRDPENASYPAVALVKLGQPGIEALRARLASSEPKVRIAALAGLARTCADETDGKLLAESFEGAGYKAIDPQKEIDDSRIQEASVKLGLSPQEVLERYSKLAKQFGLKLAERSASGGTCAGG